MEEKLLWWQKGIVYQIYPRSFCDSNGDGIGDLQGIRSKLPFLKELGIDAIWISPIFPSPMADFGYDVADYCGIAECFGHLRDFDQLLAEAHAHDIKVLLDFVPNHSSDLHPWFLESKSSRENPKRDWYVWRDPKPDGSPPNNWMSFFGGPAWDLDPVTGQYYLHLFLKEQPDLNWRNKEVVEAMMNVLKFWLERGVDGFRVDVMWTLIKDEQLRDNPPNPKYHPGLQPMFMHDPVMIMDRPETHGVVARMRQVLDSFDERVLIGEIYLPYPKLVTYYGTQDCPEAHLPFNFGLLELFGKDGEGWCARGVAKWVNEYEKHLPASGWPNYVLGNHDQPRIVSRIGANQARIAAMLLLTLRGTPTIYNGEEIGMHNVDVPQDRLQDPVEFRDPGKGRDPERTPMQWDATTSSGFSSSEHTWLPIGDDFKTLNVEEQKKDPQSLLNLYKAIIQLRRESPALISGSYQELEIPKETSENVFVFVRSSKDAQNIVVALNFSGEKQEIDLSSILKVYPGKTSGRVLLSTKLEVPTTASASSTPLSGSVDFSARLALRPDEGIIIEVL